ncbi:hypothetical protein D3C76_429750 [compost metagenome]
MKRTLIAMALIGFTAFANAEKAPTIDGKELPMVAKCMEMHSYAAIAFNSADPRDAAEYNRFMRETFTDEERWNYNNQIKEWNDDKEIKKAYNDLRGPDIVGWSLTPALQMAACIKAL